MNRSRKSVCQTPVQKTTLLSFFERTPSSVNKLQKCDIDTKVSDRTSATAPQTPYLTPSILRGRPKDVECPACRKMVRYYSLNEHLDTECVPSEQPQSDDSVKKEDMNFASISAQVPETNIVLYTENKSKVVITEETCQVSNSAEVSAIHIDSIKIDHTPVKTERVETQNNPKTFERPWHTSPKKLCSNDVYLKLNGMASDSKLVVNKKDAKTNSRAKKKLMFQSTESVESLEMTRTKRKYAMPYYLETFLFLVNSTFKEPLYQHLFIEEDALVYNRFSSLSLDAKKLYVRLFSRKFQWRRRSKIVYDDIAEDLSPLLNELCQSGFLYDVNHLNELDSLLKLLYQPEIKELFKEMKIPFNGKINAIEVTSALHT